MAKNCVIKFDQNEYGTYYTGQQLTGKVIINLNKPKTFREIKLQVIGYAQCLWRNRHGRTQPIYNKNLKRKHQFFGHEDYIASTTYLVGSEAGENNTIDSGTHTYSFSCPIPLNCPSSYEGTFGHIRYIVKVTFIKCGLSNRTHTKGFTVLQSLDLNRESALLRSPACNESCENFCFLSGKPVHLRVDVNQTGYVPGQMILVSAHVNNESGADVKKLSISLNLRATYTSDTPSMRTINEKFCLVKNYCGPVAHHSVKDFTEMLRVPATPPTCYHLSKVVRISYEIRVKAIMNNLMNNPITVIPITIGNVPLVTIDDDIEPNLTHMIDNVATTSTFALQRDGEYDRNLLNEDSELDYDELPPPSYEEAIFMTTNITDDDVNTVSEHVQFTPRYPVYNVDNIVMPNVMAQSPPPNPPQKRKVRRKKKILSTEMPSSDEKPPRESPVEI